MSANKIVLAVLTIMTFGCRSEKATEDTAAWWETDGGSQEGTSEDEDKPDYTTGDEDKPDESSYQDCGEDFDPTATCEGGWEDTLCMHDGLIWWCENGVWLNEDDK